MRVSKVWDPIALQSTDYLPTLVITTGFTNTLKPNNFKFDLTYNVVIRKLILIVRNNIRMLPIDYKKLIRSICNVMYHFFIMELETPEAK